MMEFKKSTKTGRTIKLFSAGEIYCKGCKTSHPGLLFYYCESRKKLFCEICSRSADFEKTCRVSRDHIDWLIDTYILNGQQYKDLHELLDNNGFAINKSVEELRRG